MIARLARAVGCTDGQAWTLLLGAVLAVVSVGFGLPPAFRGGDAPQAMALAPAPPGPRVGPEDDAEVPVLVTLDESARPSPLPAASLSTRTPTTTPRPATPPTSSPATTVVAPVALSVRESGWASARGGTPVAPAEVPDGSLPIGARAGITDELSLVRLAGTDAVLRLESLDDPLASGAVLQACPIDEATWEPTSNMTLDQAPAYDCERAAVGILDETGTWSFDLSAFADREGPRGFALVPGEGAGTFRVRLSTTPR